MITTQTGAFYPAIPPYYASQKLHDVLIGEDELAYVRPQVCNIPQGSSVDFVKMLNIFWQVKTFDAIIDWDFAEPPVIEDAVTTYAPSKNGQITIEDIPLIDPQLEPDPQNPSGPQIPTNPWRDVALGLVVGNLKLVETPYDEDRDQARADVRATYSFNTAPTEFEYVIKSESPYQTERTALVSDFDFYFADWTTRTQATLDSLAGNQSDVAQKWTTDLTRQLSAIPVIKTTFENTHLNPILAAMDASYASQGNADYGFLLASEAKARSMQFRNAVTREEDLEMFDLLKGFERGYKFLPWHYQRRFGAESLPVQRGFDSAPTKFPCGFYFEEVAQKYIATILLRPITNSGLGWITQASIPYTASKKTCDTVGTVSRFAKKSLSYSVLYSPIGTDQTRVKKEKDQIFADGEVWGGQFTNCTGEGLPEGTFEYQAGFLEVYDVNGDAINAGDPPDINEAAQSEEANTYVYSGPYFSGRNYDGVAAFFADVAQGIKSVFETEIDQVGVFRFKSADDDVIDEFPIYGNPAIWTKFDITYKVKSRWDDPAP